MKRLLLWINVIVFFLLSVSGLKVNANENDWQESIGVTFKHQNKSREDSLFSIYLLTQEEYEEAITKRLETTVEKTNQFLKVKNKEPIKNFSVSESEIMTFNLLKYSNEGAPAYYVIVQGQPDSTQQQNDTLVESLPNYISFDQLKGTSISIEAKPVTLTTNAYFFKYSSGETKKPLEEAEFAFYRINSMNEKEYLIKLEPIQWEKISNTKDVWHVKSDKQGLVTLPHIVLPVGEYYFEETKAPDGFLLTAESKKIPLIVSENKMSSIQMTVNGEILQAHHAGKLPEQVMKEAVPKVFNKPKDASKIPSKLKYLPKTGEHLFAFSSVGLVMMFVSIKMMKRGKENE